MQENIPYLIEGDEKLVEYVANSKKTVDFNLKKYGALLFRGFKIYSLSEFQKVSNLICNELFNYEYRSTPRTQLGGKVYTSTEYPHHKTIPLHNENSYTLNWPEKILFFCAIEPSVGGETPIANGSFVYELIEPEVREKFIKKGIMYVRNFSVGLDLPWQEVFQTSDKTNVEKFCLANHIEFEWLSDSELRTKQVCQAVLQHPLHKKNIWFNQAHLFHYSNNEVDLKSYLLEHVDPVYFPRNSYYGDGSEIELEVLNEIQNAYQKAEIVFKWQKNDLMVLDNCLYAHGRRPYEGERKIVVTMGN